MIKLKNKKEKVKEIKKSNQLFGYGRHTNKVDNLARLNEEKRLSFDLFDENSYYMD